MQLFARLASLAAWLILLHSHALASGAVWTTVSTPNLVVLTTGEAVAAAEAVSELESLRQNFRHWAPALATTGAPLRIVAFSSESEYQAFRLNSHSPAYFVGGPGQQLIVLGRLAKDTIPSLRHEYVHYLLKQSAQSLPLWLEEGLAEHHGGVAKDVARSRSRLLRRGGWIPLAELLRAGKDSAWYKDRDLAARFYAESWALVDLLMKRTDGSTLESLASLQPGKLLEMESELRRHVRKLRGSQASAAELVETEKAQADPGEVELTLARLHVRLGDLDGASQRAIRLTGERPEAWAVLGDVALKQGRNTEARAAYREAMQRGAADARALWQLAVLEQAVPDADMVPVLETLVAADPTHDEARLVLSSHYLRRQKWSDALEQLRRVRHAPADKSDFYQRALAFAESRVTEPRSSDSLE